MTTYAPVPAFADQKRHPRALLLIVAGHAALLAAVMTAKMDLPTPWDPTVTEVKLVPIPADPPKAEPQPKQQPRQTVIEKVPTIVPVPQPNLPDIDRAPVPLPIPDPGPFVIDSDPVGDTTPAPVRTGPHFITREGDIKPPYPQSKLRQEEEAVLRLKLTIDSHGRVTAVEPVGRADPVFLAAARRHITARWRYRAATEDGRAIASSTVITLRFELDD